MHDNIPMIHCKRNWNRVGGGGRAKSMKPCQPAHSQHQRNRSNSLEQAAHTRISSVKHVNAKTLMENAVDHWHICLSAGTVDVHHGSNSH